MIVSYKWHNVKLLRWRSRRWHIAAEIEDNDFRPLQSLAVPSRHTPPSIARDCPATAPGGSLDMCVWQTERETHSCWMLRQRCHHFNQSKCRSLFAKNPGHALWQAKISHPQGARMKQTEWKWLSGIISENSRPPVAKRWLVVEGHEYGSSQWKNMTPFKEPSVMLS